MCIWNPEGIEKVSKFMMTALLLIMIVLAIHSVMMKGAGAGIRFYLIPDFRQMAEIGIGNVVFGAMSQAFFTLSIGIGSDVDLWKLYGKRSAFIRRGCEYYRA